MSMALDGRINMKDWKTGRAGKKIYKKMTENVCGWCIKIML